MPVLLPAKVKRWTGKMWTPERDRELVQLVLAYRHNKSDPYGAASVALQKSCKSCYLRYLKLAKKMGVTWKYSPWTDQELQQLDSLRATHEHTPDCWKIIVAAMPKRAKLLKNPELVFRERWRKLRRSAASWLREERPSAAAPFPPRRFVWKSRATCGAAPNIWSEIEILQTFRAVKRCALDISSCKTRSR